MIYDTLFEKVQKHMKWSEEKTTIWFNTANPNLGMVTPIYMIVIGRGKKLEKFIDDCIEESSL